MKIARLLLFMLLASPALAGGPQDLTKDAKVCAKHGGRYGSGPFGGAACEIPYSDGGRTCSDDAQCKGGCIVEFGGEIPSPKVGVRAKGTCQKTNLESGCFAHIKKSRVQPELCI